jgi:hypothetical protein
MKTSYELFNSVCYRVAPQSYLDYMIKEGINDAKLFKQPVYLLECKKEPILSLEYGLIIKDLKRGKKCK